MGYFNTLHERGQTLKKYHRKALSQDQIILSFFLANPMAKYSPTQIHKLLPHAPITSVRRSITNLTRKGKLIKTDTKAIGMYGREEYCWRYR